MTHPSPDQPLSECKGLTAIRVIFKDHNLNQPETSFRRIQESLPPTITSVVIVGSASLETFFLLRSFSAIALAHSGIQYHIYLSSSSIHDLLDPGDWEILYWENESLKLDEWDIRPTAVARPIPLREGPNGYFPCE